MIEKFLGVMVSCAECILVISLGLCEAGGLRFFFCANGLLSPEFLMEVGRDW